MEFIDLKEQYRRYRDPIQARINKVLDSGQFIMGPEIKELESTLATYVGMKHGIGCGNGTDALLLPLMAHNIGTGDEVITVPFTFAASAEVAAFLGAKPVFVDVDTQNFTMNPELLEKAITSRTKAIIPVSLYGHPADMDAINVIARKHNVLVIEDACQSFGAIYKGKKSCGLSEYGATSFFPSKPLGCYGDGGMVFTNDDAMALKLRNLVAHGQSKRYEHKYIGLNFRLDTLQAAVMLAKWPHFEEEASARKRIGEKYSACFANSNATAQKIESWCDRTIFAQYSLRVPNREKLLAELNAQGIPTAVHYPIPLHLQEAYRYLGYKEGDFPVSEQLAREIMSLPMHPFLSDAEVIQIATAVKNIIGK
jgi:UDP-2-acetamido-2-deoxy-ribo-hexuluronate aminotransferase